MQSDSTDVPLDYYARQGIMTDPLENADLLKELPADIPTLCLASISLAGNESFHEIRMIYERDNRLHVPYGWKP